MAATDQFYRNQKALNIVFAVSCILLLLSTLWMFAQDYYRPFKDVQRKFRDVEAAVNERLMLDQLPEGGAFEEARQAVVGARQELAKKRAEVSNIEKELIVERDKRDSDYRAVKADYDSLVSYYNISIEHLGEAKARKDDQEVERLRREVERRQARMAELEAELSQCQDDLDETKQKIQEQVEDKLKGHKAALAEAERELKEYTGAFDRFAKATSQKTWKFGDTFRALPILDGFESPTKIHQFTLPDLTIDYGGFKDVPRYDRCTTCHLGIDRGIFDRKSLAELSTVPLELEEKLEGAEDLFKERQQGGESLGFNPGNLPSTSSSVPFWLGLVLAILSVTASVILCLTGAARLGTGIGLGGVTFAFLTWLLTTLLMTGDPVVKKVDLTSGEVTQYCAHPRLELFVGSNSPHPVQKFGCTICHEGQGSATDFFNAAHTPSNSPELHEWEKKHHWHRSHFWDFPMLSSRFVESSCLKCHHQVTDLIREGSKEEAPKLLRGYELIKANGCFGCHEISGYKNGRRVGPDLRTEPVPALEYLTAAEREKISNDTSNPVGTMRKAGPSLRRLAEKTNKKWTAAWLSGPRRFRPDTKMPHFYGLSTNSKEAIEDAAKEIEDPQIKKKVLEQASFPHTEIHAIAHYLITESKAALDPNGDDFYRGTLIGEIQAVQAILEKQALVPREHKTLQTLTKQLGNLALISQPEQATAIHEALRQLQEQQALLQHHHEHDETVTTEERKVLQTRTQSLIELAHPRPLGQKVIDGEGNLRPIPAAPAEKAEQTKHLEEGARLFTERGCLACHFHQHARVRSEANFGPDLSRLAAKLGPAIPGVSARHWLIQWILNPNIHHPRTKMPINHLTVEQAAAVADWLLAQPAEGWKGEGPEQPSQADLIRLARVYLVKAPGFTPREVDQYLPDPDEDGAPTGIAQDKLIRLAADADEHRLATINEDNLKWYIGKKAIGRMGCFGCHDVPGFEQAKQIGTSLADWGKKDPARIAFEDGALFVRNHYHLVPTRQTREDLDKRIDELLDKEELTQAEEEELEQLENMEPWEEKDGQKPYEEFFFHALEHHQREGFLHQKLLNPRSYDYHRLRAWDDRLRMPQFRFARSRQRSGESDEAFQARAWREEAEAREAVMTFILGLVADPIPQKYVHHPAPDRLAEVKGRQVLEKYNCAGCHRIREGVFEFKANDLTDRFLEFSKSAVAQADLEDHLFLNHNAWVAPPEPAPGRMIARGVPRPPAGEEEILLEDYPVEGLSDAESSKLEGQLPLNVYLTEALQFTDQNGQTQTLRAGSQAILVPSEVLSRSEPYGGTFAELLVPYVKARYGGRLGNEANQRSVLPPPLIREGERTQPGWLHGFLLNPSSIRPADYMLLRMPRFNMSAEEANQIVSYFSAVSRDSNPGAGITSPYQKIPQKEDEYWRLRTREYMKRLQANKAEMDWRLAYMKPIWETYSKQQLKEAEAARDAAEQAVKAETEEPALSQKKEALELAEQEVERWKKLLQDATFDDLRKRWEEQEAYATDAYRLLQRSKLPCLQCHSVGKNRTPGASGPNLAHVAERLRPEWTFQWLANPRRMWPQETVMPQNLPKPLPGNPVSYQEYFVGSSRDQARAVRDILMNLRSTAELPGARFMPAAPAPVEGGTP
jgi:mono/diheme cytochrome c family protein